MVLGERAVDYAQGTPIAHYTLPGTRLRQAWQERGLQGLLEIMDARWPYEGHMLLGTELP